LWHPTFLLRRVASLRSATLLIKIWTKNAPLAPFGHSRSVQRFVLSFYHLEVGVVHHTRFLNAVEVVEYELGFLAVESVGVEHGGV